MLVGTVTGPDAVGVKFIISLLKDAKLAVNLYRIANTVTLNIIKTLGQIVHIIVDIVGEGVEENQMERALRVTEPNTNLHPELVHHAAH